jgi:hypothetical protein
LPAKPTETQAPEPAQNRPDSKPAPAQPREANAWLARLRAMPVEPSPSPAEPSPSESESEDPALVRERLARLGTPPAQASPSPTESAPGEFLSDEPTKTQEQLVPQSAEPAEAPKPSAASAQEPPAEESPISAETETLQAGPPDQAPPLKSSPSTPLIDETPSWLTELHDTVTASENTGVSDDQLPDWLQAPAKASLEETTPSQPEPTWLKQIAIDTSTAPAETPEESKESPVDESVPPLAKTSPSEPLIASLEAAVASTSADEDLQLPAWASQAPESATDDEEEIPDWLRTAGTGAPSGVGAQAETPARPLTKLDSAAVPDWIAALKPVGQPSLEEDEEEPVEAAGPLAGLRGVLPLAVAVIEPHAPPKPVTPVSNRENARLFDSILASSAPASVAPAAVKSKRRLTMRPLIYLVLMLAVIFPFFVPFDAMGLTIPISGGVPAETFVRTVEQLPANSTVLLSFDYDPGLAGEMDLQAQAIVRHLAKNRIKVVAVSTLETGPQVAKHVLDQISKDLPEFSYGALYLNLGFLPGQEAGLSQLATTGTLVNARDSYGKTIDKYPAFASIKTLRDLKLLIELAGAEDRLALWMTQVQPYANVKIAAGVSAAIEPKTYPYLSSQQLTAAMSGIVGAAQYEILSRQSSPGNAVIAVNAQTAAQVTIILFILLGNLIALYSRWQGKSK